MKWSVAIVLALMLFVIGAHAAQTASATRWQGTTGNGRAVLLELKLTGSQVTGTLSVDGDVTPISDMTFSFKAKADGQPLTVHGRVLPEGLDLLPEGAANSVVVTRGSEK
jgi:hypothetical protein